MLQGIACGVWCHVKYIYCWSDNSNQKINERILPWHYSQF